LKKCVDVDHVVIAIKFEHENVGKQLAKKRPNVFGFFISKFLGVQPIFSKRMMFNIKAFWKTLAF
jgi:nitrogen regulatory protein PII-like uncharacterized protein